MRLLRRFEVADSSMEPELEPGDYIAATRLSRVRRGDVVVFPHPERDGFWLVKRVVGLPGDRVRILGGVVTHNGEDVPGPVTPGEGTWEVNESELFVLSDARAATLADSRTYGPVPGDDAWRVVLRYWPPRRLRWKMHTTSTRRL